MCVIVCACTSTAAMYNVGNNASNQAFPCISTQVRPQVAQHWTHIAPHSPKTALEKNFS